MVYKGKTEDANSPILGAGWWKKGKKIVGKVLRSFKTENGECYSIDLAEAVLVPDLGQLKLVSVGALKGFQMALAAAGLSGLKEGDGLFLECTGETGTDKGNPMVNFYVEVHRN